MSLEVHGQLRLGDARVGRGRWGRTNADAAPGEDGAGEHDQGAHDQGKHGGCQVGGVELDIDLVAEAGKVTALLGPNGAGKTTLLRAVAGTIGLDRGSIVLAGKVLDEPPRCFVPSEDRQLGVVHQDHLLFPHLSALDNVAFGPRCRGQSKALARRSALELLEAVGLGEQARQRPRSLSGGQAQRVALARALALDPVALLLDEPLAALDAATRVEVRRELRRHLVGFAGPTVLITHDAVDAMALADRVAVMENGRITQVDTLAEVMARPRSRYVADLIGTNLLYGPASGTTVTTDQGATLTLAEPHHGDVAVTLAPAAVALHPSPPEGSPRNRWSTTVRHLDLVGDRVRVGLGDPLPLTAEITAAARAELDLHEGDEIWVAIKATEIVPYPR